jgi:hypothetical protein
MRPNNPDFDPLGVGDANDVMYGTFIGMITAITILIIYCFAHGEDACGMSPHHGCFVGTDDIIVIAPVKNVTKSIRRYRRFGILNGEASSGSRHLTVHRETIEYGQITRILTHLELEMQTT